VSHAEVIAVINATKYIGSEDLSDCELYTTVEPCFMCSYLIRETKIKKVLYGVKAGEIGGASSPFPLLRSDSISVWSSPPEIIGGIMKEECARVLKK
jgi:tRNA(adenine34) deaminase